MHDVIEPRGPRRVELWRLHHPDGRIHSCVLVDDTGIAAGWEVAMLLNDELVFGKRCLTEADARYAAKASRQDTERGGFQEWPVP